MIRNFTLTNALGASFSLMNAQQGAFFEPQGLGYDDVTQYEQVGEFFAPLTQRYGQQVVTGSMVFGSQPYEHYLTFTKFCQHAPLSLVYETNAGTFQIPCRLTKIEKGDTDGWTYLNCKVEFTALARMFKTVVANNTGTAGGGKEYFEKSYPDVSGSIVTIMDNTSTQTTVNLSADINPVQDLNGYDAPWVGGAGANKWDEEWENGRIGTTGENQSGNGIRSKNYISVSPSTQYHGVSGTYTGASSITVFYYDTNKDFISLDNKFGMSVNFTTPNNCYYIRFNIMTSVAITTYNNDIAINYPSTVTTYAPYSNICPITGWSAVNVTMCGINVWDEEWELGSLNASGNKVSASTSIRTKNYVPILPSTTYYYKAPNATGRTCFYDKDKNHINADVGFSANATFTTPPNAYYMLFVLATAYGTTYNNDISINYPSTDHEYHAYNGQSYTTALGRTVYGGTLDVVSGLLTVTHEIRSYVGDSSENWSKSSVYQGSFYIDTSVAHIKNTDNTWCSHAKYVTGLADYSFGKYLLDNTNNTTLNIWIQESGTTKEQFKQYLADQNTAGTPLQVVLELATPQTYQLTPQQIELLLGTNYVWANSGDVYLSNLKTYGYIYDYVYGDFVADTVTIDSDSTTSSPCKITIFGECTQPTWRHYLDGNSVATGYYNGTIPSGHKLVIDTTSSPYSIQEEDTAGNLIADRYELCDFSTERFFLLEYGHNTISVSHTDPDSIRLMVEGYIFYETV